MSMPSVGLRLRLVVPLAWVLILYGAFCTYITARARHSEMMAEATLSTLRLAGTVRRSTRHAMLQSRRDDILTMVAEIGAQPDMDHVRIFNKEGVIAYSADASEINQVVDRRAEGCYQCHASDRPATTLDAAERSRVYESLSGARTLAAMEVIYNEPSCWSAACHAHPPEQRLLGVIDVGTSLREADQRVARTTRNTVLVGALSTVIICGIGTLMVQRMVVKPVRSLLASTQRVAAGDLDCRMPVTSADEIGQLTRSFVAMTEHLQAAHRELRGWADKLSEEVAGKTRDLQRAQAHILRSEKLSSIGLLAAGVAHELNSPLTGILTFAHVLAKRAPPGSEEQQQLQLIGQQAERCAVIIRQLLDLSRERKPEKSLHDLHGIIEQSLALVAHQRSFQAVQVHRDYDPHVVDVMVDANQLQQVIVNLLVNAGEAMPDGGPLSIRTRRIRPSTLPVAGSDGDAVQIVVSDTGVGIAPENVRRIFDPFFTTKDVGQGTGLGLAISHGIIEQHGGQITVDSTVGEGTTFTITLPVGSPRQLLQGNAPRDT
ncbi:MAG: ATP-binding protein [Pirellulaceae bacterium]|nr:ATP-binding protein [Pirellulaceae bacterium]